MSRQTLKVVSFSAAALRTKRRPPPKPARKKAAPKGTGRTFEVLMNTWQTNEVVSRIRIRFDRGSFHDNTVKIAGNSYLVGHISEHLHGKVWSAYGYGMVCPGDFAFLREVFADTAQVKPTELGAPKP